MKQVKQHINLIKYIALSLMLMLMGVELIAQAVPLVNIKGGAKVYFGKDAPIIINGSINNEQYSQVTLNGQMKIYGSWNNNGIQTALDGSLVEFIGPEEADIKGSGNTQFFKILVNKESKEVRLTLATVLSNTPDGFVELAKGLFEVKCGVPYANTFLGQGVDGYANIPVDAQFWLNDEQVTVKPAQYDMLLKGVLKVLKGQFNAGKMLFYANQENDSRVAEIEIQDAVLEVARGIRPLGNVSQNINFAMNEGVDDTKKATLNLHTNETAYQSDPLAENYALWIEGENSNVSLQDGTINVNANFGYNYGKTTLKVKPKESNGKNVILNVFNDNASAPENTAVHIDSKAEYKEFNINFKARNQSAVVESDLVINGNITISGNDNNMLVSKAVTTLRGNLDIESTSETPIFCDNENAAIEFADDLLNGDNADQAIKTTTSNLNLQYLRITKDKKNPINYGAHLTNLTISNELRLNGKFAILNVGENTITMPYTAKVTTGKKGNLTHPNEFNKNKYIRFAGADVTPLESPLPGGKMIRTFAEAGTMNKAMDLIYPIGDAELYAPASLKIFKNISFTAGSIEVKTIPQAHPEMKKTAYGLNRFWNVKNNVTFTGANAEDGAGEIRFIYPQDNVKGVERKYLLARYSPAWDNPDGAWDMKPGMKFNEVDYIANTIDSRGLPAENFSGDWTAGEEKAFYSVFYSRADGLLSDNNTWSNEDFGGAPALKAPSSKNDVIYVLGNTVTVDKDVDAAIVEVRTSTPERTAGVIKLNDEYKIKGGEFTLEKGTSIYINSAKGIYLVPEALGHIQTEKRTFSGEASYYYVGGSAQITGTGLPAQVNNLTIDKTPGTAVVELTRNTYIMEKLHIENGVFKVNTNIIDGSIPNRTFTMNGGEFVISNTFPLNYTPPVFTKGTVNFSGRNPVVIPSDASVPAVAQYHNLKISADHSQDAHEVKFEPIGEIKIGNDFDISEFRTKGTNNVSNLFITKGSTVVFNADTEEQQIPIYYNSPGMDVALTNITYNKVVLRGTGKKKLFNIDSANTSSYGWASGLTTDTLVFEPNSKLHTHGNNITIGKFWDDRGGTLVTDNQQTFGGVRVGNTVYFEKRRASPLDPAYISIANPTNYVFHKVEINKATKLKTDFRVRDIKLESKLIAEGNQNITVYGNWTQDADVNNPARAEFIPANSTVTFTKSDNPDHGYYQGAPLSNTILVAAERNDSAFIGDKYEYEDLAKNFMLGEETFHNLVINNPEGVNVIVHTDPVHIGGVSNKALFGGIYAKGTLTLKNGVINLRKYWSGFNNGNLFQDDEIDKPTQYVKVDNPIARTNGYVDGRLMAKIPVGATAYKFEIGKTETVAGKGGYMPVTLNTEGEANAGKEGYVEVRIMDNDRFIGAGDFTIPNSGLKFEKRYGYSHYIELPLNAPGFELGKRTYNAQVTINQAALAAQSNPNDLEFASVKRQYESDFWYRYDRTKWVKPYSYDDQQGPSISERTNNSLTISKLKHFGLFMLSQSSATKFWSRVAEGNWDDPNSWSTIGYNGPPATSYPGDPQNIVCEVYIGHKHLIKMTRSITINAGAGDATNAGVYLDSTAGGGKLYIVERKDQWGNVYPYPAVRTLLQGSGKFRMLANSWLKIEHPYGIAPAAGCIMLADKDFNYGGHNKSSFEYNAPGSNTNVPASSGIGIPDVVKSLKIVHHIQMDKVVTVNDSLYIADGSTLNLWSSNLANKRINIAGNLRFGNNGWINDNDNSEVVVAFVGDSLRQYVSLDPSAINASSAFELKVKNLHIDKPRPKSRVVFRRAEINGLTNNHSHKLQIDGGSLKFLEGNKASIQMESYKDVLTNEPRYNAGEWYVEIHQSAKLIRESKEGSFIDGELRKYVTSEEIQSLQGVTFEVGSNDGYRPFEMHIPNCPAGYLGVHQISGSHFKIDVLAQHTGYNAASMMKQYWRVIKDATSGFNPQPSSTNLMWLAANYIMPDDIPDYATDACFDFVRYDDVATTLNGGWQVLHPSHLSMNYNFSGGVNCIGRTLGPENYRYPYNIGSKAGHTQVNDVNMGFGDHNLGGNRILLGDFVLGEKQNKPLEYYSKNNGKWSDPNTWVTGSYDSQINEGTYPKFYNDIAYVGNGVTVELDGDVGTGWPCYSSYPEVYALQRIASLVVESTQNGGPGRLNAKCFRIRALKFSLKEGGILETGYLGGLPSEGNRGNFINENIYNGTNMRIAKEYNFGGHNKGNIIIKPYGRVPENTQDNLFTGLRNMYEPKGNIHPNISSVSIYQNNSLVKTYAGLTRNSLGYSRETAIHNFDVNINNPNAANQETTTFEVELVVDRLRSDKTYYFKVHADYDFDVELDEVSQQTVVSYPSSSQRTVRIPVTLKNGLEHGTTTMRVYCMSREIPLGIENTYTTSLGGSRMYEIRRGEILSDIKDFLISINRSSADQRDMVANIMPGMPEQVGSLVIDSWENKTLDTATVNKRAPIVKLPYKLQINDSLAVHHGYFHFDTLNIGKKVVNRFHQNSLIDYTKSQPGKRGTISVVGNGKVELIGAPYERTDGVVNFTSYNINSIHIPKSGEDIVISNSPVRIERELKFAEDRIIDVVGSGLYFGSEALKVTSVNGEFSKNRMIKTFHDTDDDLTKFGVVRKEGVQKTVANLNPVGKKIDFTFPIGARGQYAPVDVNTTINVDNNMQNGEWTYLECYSVPFAKDDWLLNTKSLDRMWYLSTKGTLSGDYDNQFKMHYLPQNVRGDIKKYIAGRYDKANAVWDIDFGSKPIIDPSPITFTMRYNFDSEKMTGYYTAGELTSMKERLVFYNRTEVANFPNNKPVSWFRKEVWSTNETLKHRGSASSYYPGELTKKDIVNIDHGQIIFGGDTGLGGLNGSQVRRKVVIDSIHFGKTYILDGNTNADLIFPKRKPTDDPNEERSIILNKGIKAEAANVSIVGSNRNDMLIINDSIDNESNTQLFVRHDANSKENMSVIFKGTGTSVITGEGKWNVLQTSIILDKEGGLLDSLVIKSQSYAGSSSTAPAYEDLNIPTGNDNNYAYPQSSMKLLSGVLRNDTELSMGVTGHLFIGEGAGVHLRDENVWLRVALGLYVGPDPMRRTTDKKQTILIENGGQLSVGMHNDHSKALNKRELMIHENSDVHVKGGGISAFSSIKLKEKGKFTIDKPEIPGIVNDVWIGFEPKTQVNNLIATKFLAVEESEFNMHGGRIRIQKTNARLNDQPVMIVASRNGVGFEGGTVEIGNNEYDAVDMSGDPVKYSIRCNIPFNHLTCVAPSIEDFNKTINEINFLDEKVVIKGNLYTYKNFHFKTGIADVALGGSLTIRGKFDALTGAGDKSARVFEFFGNNYQIISHAEELDGLEFYNVKINKHNMNNVNYYVRLNPGANTKIIIRNALEFAEGNEAIINTSCENSNQYFERGVYFKPLEGVQVAQYIVRNGQGHIYGTQINYMRDEATSTKFHVGGPLIADYYPMTVATSGTNSAGYLSGTFTSSFHDKINDGVDNEIIKKNAYVPKYWTLEPIEAVGSNQFALLGDNSYTLRVDYPEGTLNQTPKGSFDINEGMMYMYSRSIHGNKIPGFNGNPANDRWEDTETDSVRITMAISRNNKKFGDIIIAEQDGLKFYSRQTGLWSDVNTWTHTPWGTGTPSAVLRIPNRKSDKVYISQNHEVIIRKDDRYEVGEVNVMKTDEVDPITNQVIPNQESVGKLRINGRYNRLITKKFNLEDKTFLYMQNAYGICEPKEDKGVIFAKKSANYGISHYIYSSNEGPQSTGVGLPNTVLSITQSNDTDEGVSRILTIHREDDQPQLEIYGFLNVLQGRFDPNGRNLEINGGINMAFGRFDGIFNRSKIDITVRPLSDKGITGYQYAGLNLNMVQLIIDNKSGLPIYNLRLNGLTKLLSNNIYSDSYATQKLVIDKELTRLIPGGPFYLNQQANNYVENRKLPVLILASNIDVDITTEEPNAIRNVKLDDNGQIYDVQDDDKDRAIFYIQKEFPNSSDLSGGKIGNRPYVIRRVRNNREYNFFVTSSGHGPGGEFEGDEGIPLNLYQTLKIETIPDGSHVGKIGVTTQAGSIDDTYKPHFKISQRKKAVYNRRFWSIDSVTYKGKMKLILYNQTYDVLDKFTTKDTINLLSRYSIPQEGRGGKIKKYKLTNENMIFASKWKGTEVSLDEYFDKNSIKGDWLLTNKYALRRIFYSRQTGNWESPESWTAEDTHQGDIFGQDEYPNDFGDSVVIAHQHVITMNKVPFTGTNYEETGVQIGYAAPEFEDFSVIDNYGASSLESKNKTGTLIMKLKDGDALTAERITVNQGSTIGTTSKKGFADNNFIATATDGLNISDLAVYRYIGSEQQELGNLVKDNIGFIIVDKNDGYLDITKDLTTAWGWGVFAGKLNMKNFKFIDNNSGYNLQSQIMGENAWITIGEQGKPGLSFTDVFGADRVWKEINSASTVEFAGVGHDLSTTNTHEGGGLLANAFDSNMLVSGSGNTEDENTASYFNKDITILGNLTIKPIDNAINNVLPKVVLKQLSNNNLVTVSVRKSVMNYGHLENNGIIEVGQCQE